MANEATGVSAVADRYATAIFELAEDRGATDAVADDVAGLASLLGESADLRRVVESPVLSRADQGRGMDAVLEKAGADPLTRNLVRLMARNRRLFYLPEVIEAFRQKLAAQRGEPAAPAVLASSGAAWGVCCLPSGPPKSRASRSVPTFPCAAHTHISAEHKSTRRSPQRRPGGTAPAASRCT